MDWKEITSHLYENIQPVGGGIRTMASDSYKATLQFSNFWIEFDMNKFIYEDLFYGEQLSTDPFKMNVDLTQIAVEHKIKEINELEGLTIIKEYKNAPGDFSNSLEVVPHYLKFGEITGDKIDFEMRYSLTNTDSYGMMDGTREEHLQVSGVIALAVKICDLEIIVRKENGLKKILAQLNPKIYKLQSVKQTQAKTADLHEEKFEISYNDISFKGKRGFKKWWPF